MTAYEKTKIKDFIKAMTEEEIVIVLEALEERSNEQSKTQKQQNIESH